MEAWFDTQTQDIRLLGPENYRMPEHQMVPTVTGMQPGEIRFVEVGHILIEPTEERKVWIYKYAQALELEDAAKDYLEYVDEDHGPEYARVICIDENLFIVDQSHLEHTDWSSVEDRYHQVACNGVLAYPDLYAPVAFRAFTSAEMNALEPELAEYNIRLDGTNVEDMLAIVQAYYRAAQNLMRERREEDDNESSKENWSEEG